MIDKQIIAYLKPIHGAFNILVMLLLIYQGWVGLRIRNIRRAGKPPDFKIIKRHRKNGPFFTILGCLGFIAGIIIVYLDKGGIFEYPLHLITGLVITFSLITTYLISKRISGAESPLRTPHFILGIGILGLYLIQVFLGLGILF
ncbi:MAG: DUF4079 family protein [Thermodesulfovibrionales bacterium]|jgi:hypothetical protein